MFTNMPKAMSGVGSWPRALIGATISANFVPASDFVILDPRPRSFPFLPVLPPLRYPLALDELYSSFLVPFSHQFLLLDAPTASTFSDAIKRTTGRTAFYLRFPPLQAASQYHRPTAQP